MKQNKKNIWYMGLTSFFTDVSSEMIFPILPLFLTTVLNANMAVVGLIEGVAESASALLKLISGWVSDKLGKKKPLIIKVVNAKPVDILVVMMRLSFITSKTTKKNLEFQKKGIPEVGKK